MSANSHEDQSDSPLIFYKNRITASSDWQLPSSNRSFRYGDGVFETIRICKGVPLYFPHHYSRFILGLEVLKLEIPEFWQPEWMRQTMMDLSRQNGLPNARLRMSAWRDGAGKYLPQSSIPELLIETESLAEPFYQWPKAGLKIDLAEGITIGRSALDRLKSANSLPYIMAAIQAKERALDDVLLMNESGYLVEASSSNLFVFKDGVLFSPPHEDGGIDGVLRRVLLKIARKEGIRVEVKRLWPDDLEQADEVFLTNVISGIRWVSRFRDREYSNQFSFGLFGKLEEKILAELS